MFTCASLRNTFPVTALPETTPLKGFKAVQGTAATLDLGAGFSSSGSSLSEPDSLLLEPELPELPLHFFFFALDFPSFAASSHAFLASSLDALASLAPYSAFGPLPVRFRIFLTCLKGSCHLS